MNFAEYLIARAKFGDLGCSSGGSGDIIVDNVIWGGASDSVTGNLAANGVIRYVTFMNHDGTVEYGRKSVLAGEDCVDPVTAGHMSTPTRESTAQYSYTFSGGWATTPNGGKDANALKVVTEDRTVYANFVAAVRYYTITFYDSDGSTVLTTQSMAYGSIPNYKPEKEGYSFAGWDRDVETVTGEASYTASWSEKLSFANSTWADIARVAEAGEASNHFAVGDERVETIDGKAVTLVIVAFNKDRVKDRGYRGITIVNKNAYTTETVTNPMGVGKYNSEDYSGSTISTTVNGLLSKFPADLQAVVKEARKCSTDAAGNTIFADYSVWLLAAREMANGFNLGDAWENNNAGSAYEGFTKYPTLLSYDGNYWTRTLNSSTYWYTLDVSKVNGYINNGYSPFSTGHKITGKCLIRFGFCV